jgi:hypothetical protein
VIDFEISSILFEFSFESLVWISCFAFVGKTFGFSFTLVLHSKLFKLLLVLLMFLLFPYFFILLINCHIFSLVTHTTFAISQINLGLANHNQAINAGFANCQNTIHHQVITQANHFAKAGFKLAPATCACIFLPVYCSISFTISCLAVKLSLNIEFNFVIAV